MNNINSGNNIQLNQSEVEICKRNLETNIEKMEAYYQKYQTEINKLGESFKGAAAGVSIERINQLEKKYKNFLQVANSFFNGLSSAENIIIEADLLSASSGYNF